MCCNWWNGFMVRSLTQATPTGQSERVVQAHTILVGILAAAAVGTISRLFTCKLLCKGYFLFVLVIFRPFYEFFPLIPLTRRRMQCNWAVKSLAWAYFKVLHRPLMIFAALGVGGRPKELMFGKVNITFFFTVTFCCCDKLKGRKSFDIFAVSVRFLLPLFTSFSHCLLLIFRLSSHNIPIFFATYFLLLLAIYVALARLSSLSLALLCAVDV